MTHSQDFDDYGNLRSWQPSAPPAGAQEAPAWQTVPHGWTSLKDAAEEFVRRVEAGEILSKHSYQRFTQALQEIAASSEERK
jgi:hypothetical protein